MMTYDDKLTRIQDYNSLFTFQIYFKFETLPTHSLTDSLTRVKSRDASASKKKKKMYGKG